MYEGMIAETVVIQGDNGDQIDAYFARPTGPGPHPGVVVIHHMPGWDQDIKEIVRKIAAQGYAAICPNLHHRAGPGPFEEVVARVREAGGSRDDFVVADLEASVDYLLASTSSNGKVGAIGFCSGGRISYMVGAKIKKLNAVVDCWGGNVVVDADKLTPAQPQAVIDMTSEIDCPVLGLFGNDDANPDPEQVNIIEAELKKHGKTYEFHTYESAGHGFFADYRPSYR